MLSKNKFLSNLRLVLSDMNGFLGDEDWRPIALGLDANSTLEELSISHSNLLPSFSTLDPLLLRDSLISSSSITEVNSRAAPNIASVRERDQCALELCRAARLFLLHPIPLESKEMLIMENALPRDNHLLCNVFLNRGSIGLLPVQKYKLFTGSDLIRVCELVRTELTLLGRSC